MKNNFKSNFSKITTTLFLTVSFFGFGIVPAFSFDNLNGEPASVIINPQKDKEENKQERIDPEVSKEPGFSDWYSKVSKDIEKKEYEATEQEKDNEGKEFEETTYHFSNRAKNLRSYIDTQGWKLTNREEESKTEAVNKKKWNWQLTLENLTRDNDENNLDLSISEEKTLSTEENKIFLENASIKEWYENTPEGIKQNYTINEKIAGEGNLKLNAKLETNLKAELKNDNKELYFYNKDENVLILKNLKVYDADKKELESSFEYSEDNKIISIVINDKDAVYPITIDPLATTPATTLEEDQANANLGYSVASAGDVNGDGYSDVIVGVMLYDNGQTDEGAVFVYHGGASGLSSVASITLESNQADANFGISVSSAGDVNGDGYSDVIVGAYMYDNGEINEGRTFVYHGSASGLSSSASIVLESNQASAYFGYSVASAGDVNGDGYSDIIIGAYLYNNGQVGEGAAFVYHGSALGVSSSVNIILESNQADAHFGLSVASAGDVNGDGYSDVIVGALHYDNGQAEEGRAFIYYGSVSGLSSIANLTLESNQASAFFGVSVASAGDVNGDGYSDVIVGADYYDNGQADEGAAFIYLGSATGLSSTISVTLESNQISANFGNSVASAGDVNGDGYSDVIVGAYFYDNGETNEGRAYAYYGSVSGLSTTASWITESNQASSTFGYSVASAGDVNGDGYSDVIVGAPYYDNGETNEGATFIYNGGASGISSTSSVTMESDQASAYFGNSIASAGDVNGDGYSDVVVAAYYYDNGQTDEGAVFVFHGSSSGISSTPAIILESNQASAFLGNSVSSAGDVNGDGYSDIIAGAHFYDNGQADEGAAFVYYGSSSGISSSGYTLLEVNQASAYFGVAVSSAGDVNGDGYSDVIVGAHYYDNGQSNEGAAFVYLGGASGISSTSSVTMESNQASAYFGNSIASAGDVNGDGYSDVIVGAPSYDNGQTNEGVVFVFYGSASGIPATTSTKLEANQASANFGNSIASAGDVNGDGYSDLIISAYKYDNGQTDEGRAFIYHGSVSGISTTPSITLEINQASAFFGNSVSSAGDVNGDGYSDVIVGAHCYDNGQTDEGASFIYQGSSSGISATPSITLEINQATAYFGVTVASAGDVNGDGYSDVIVGAHYYDNGQADEGRTFVYYGNNGGGRTINYNQLKTDNTLLSAGGMSDSKTSFKIQAIAKPFVGRTKTKLQWEVKPSGTSFDNTNLGKSSSWTDTGTAGTTITETINGLTADTRYHWRARFVYADPILQYSSPWFSSGNNGWNEYDFRTLNSVYTLTYTAGSHGSITGTTPQTVNYNASGTQVTAVPDAGYYFAGWSDEVSTASRTDANVTADISVSAIFVSADSSRRLPLAYTVHTYGTVGAGRAFQNLTDWEQLTDLNLSLVTITDQLSSGNTLYIADTTVFNDCELNESTIEVDGQILTITGVTPGESLTVSNISGTIPASTPIKTGFVLTCYDDSAPYNDSVIINGAITNSSFFRVLRAADGQKGTPTSGVRFEKIISGVNSQIVDVTENYFWVQDIAAKIVSTSGNYSVFGFRFSTGSNGGGAVGCIAYDCTGSGTGYGNGFLVADISTGYVMIINCTAINCGGGTESTLRGGIRISASTINSTAYVYNFTSIDNDSYGILCYANSGLTSTAYVKNSIAQNNSISQIATGGDGIKNLYPTTNVTSGVTFQADGYHLSSTDTVAKNNGTDLSGISPSTETIFPFNDDIDGETRDDWDIGADEYFLATHTLTYTAGTGGTISGTSPQTVNEGESGTPVEALPDSGYHFVQWSDASIQNPRTDTNVTADISVTAEFALTTISVACDASILIANIIGTGQSDLTNNDINCNIDTNSPNGYSLTWKSSTNEMISNTEPTDLIPAYIPLVEGVPEFWSIDNTTSAWGGHLGKDSTIKNTAIWGTEDNYANGKWINLKTTDTEIISSNNNSQIGGDNEILYFGAEIGQNKQQPTGEYEVSITVTAVTL